MAATPPALPLNNILEAIADKGYIVVSSFIPTELLIRLVGRIKSLDVSVLKNASVGRGSLNQNNLSIRRDSIYWLEQDNSIDNEFLQFMNALREKLNEKLYLGLFDFEAHYAIYNKNDFYKKHIDALEGKSNRILSVVLYLNEQWTEDDGGELVIYLDGNTNEKVLPVLGQTAIFLSKDFPHEVLAANKRRYSIAGWFRVNASSSSVIDTMK